MPLSTEILALVEPIAFDLAIVEGNQKPIDIDVLTAAGVLFDFSGVTTWTCPISQDYSAGAALVTITPTTPATGRVRISYTSANAATLTAAIPGGTPATQGRVKVGVYEVRVTDGSNVVTLLRGDCNLVRT